MSLDPTLLSRLNDLLSEIRSFPDPRRATTQWKQTFNLLKKTNADANRVANIVAMRGVDQLAGLLDELTAPSKPPPAEADAPDDMTCKIAMQAFRKRLKLIRLDEESQLDQRDPLSKGARSQVQSIQPPNDWPAAVWQELERRGKLRHTGKGFYELTGR